MTNFSRTILFAGGGSGGHLFPGITVAEELIRRDSSTRIVFAGSDRGIERDIVTQHGFEHHSLPVEPSTQLRRRPVRFLYRYWRAQQQARKIIATLRPDVVIGLGGFASVPVISAAKQSDVTRILMEQNTVPGRATRWLAGRSDCVCTSFEETARHLPKNLAINITGNPVRPAITQLAKSHLIPAPHIQAAVRTTVAAGPLTSGSSKNDFADRFEPGRKILLTLGGSQGAVAVNRAVLHAAMQHYRLFQDWQIVHQTGKQDFEHVAATYDQLGIDAVVKPFFDDMTSLYRKARLVVSRAGATSLAEFACAGTPAILIPYPNAIGDHQVQNAEWYRQRNAARIVFDKPQSDETDEQLAEELSVLLSNAGQLNRMEMAMRSCANSDAAASVADVVERFIEH